MLDKFSLFDVENLSIGWEIENEQRGKKRMRWWRWAIVALLFLLLSGCTLGSQSTNAPNHTLYQYVFPNYPNSYHRGDTITLTWKAVPIKQLGDKEENTTLRAAFAQNTDLPGELSKPIIINTTNWINKTYTMTFHIPKNTPAGTYELVTSIGGSSGSSVAIGRNGITIEN